MVASIDDDRSSLRPSRSGQAVNSLDASADVPLKPGDVLTVHQVSGWNDIGAAVTLTGEVTYPGTYGLQEGERLSSVIQRAGGFRITAYPDGAVLVRKQVKELEEKKSSPVDFRQIETTRPERGSVRTFRAERTVQLYSCLSSNRTRFCSDFAASRLWAASLSNSVQISRVGQILQLISSCAVATCLISPSGRASSSLVARSITLPPSPMFLESDAGWYLRRAGGATDLANRKEIFVIRANGLVVGRRSSEWYRDQVLSTRLNPGDVVVVPQKIVGGSVFWKNMLATAQVVSSIAFTAALALR